MTTMEERIQSMRERFRKMELPGMKPWYLRLDRFLQMTESLLSEQGCRECQTLAQEAFELSGTEVHDKREAEKFEERYISLFRRISDHLKEVHGYRLPNHYISRYTLLFMIVGTVAGLLVVYLGRAVDAGSWSYQLGGMLGFVTGLVAGRIAGNRKDKQMSRDGKVLFGRMNSASAEASADEG